MSMFSSALASGQLGPLMNQFGLPAEAVDAANRGGETHNIRSLTVIGTSPPSCGFFFFVTFIFSFYPPISCVTSDVEAFAKAMQASKGDSKEKKGDDEDMSLD